MTIEAATKEYEALADDWTHGKPSHTDLCRMAGETALKHGIAATSDHEGNLRFEQHQTDTEEWLARNFAIQLHFEMGAELLAEAVARNNTPEYRNHGCATHDFCDANMPMFDAWLLTMGKEPNHESDTETALWNRAWDRARAANFWCDPKG